MPLSFEPYKPAPVPSTGDRETAVYLNDELNRIGQVTGLLLIALQNIDIPDVPEPEDPAGLVPAGAVVGWTSDAGAPEHWFFCEGAQLSEGNWPALFAALGYTYTPPGEQGTGLFRLPDYRGEFLRHFDAGAGTDPDTAARTDRGDGTTGNNVGTRQADQFRAHNHTANSQAAPSNGQPAGGVPSIAGVTGTTGGNETRPRNVYTRWIMYAGVPAA